MKKLLTILLCTVLVLSMFAACADTTQKVADEASKVEEKADSVAEEAVVDVKDAVEDVKDAVTNEIDAATGVEGKNIGICIYKYDDNFMTLYRIELERYLTAGGAKVQVVDGKNDQAEQTNQIQNFINQGVDLLIVNLVQASAAPNVTDLAHAAGIPVVYINREPDVEEEERWATEDIKATYVGADARQSGTFQGEIIAELPNKGDANGDGTVGYAMIMGDPENVDAQYRTEFSIKALEDAGIKVEKLFQERGDWDQTKGQELASNALVANGDKIDVIFCNNDAMAMGALQAIESQGRIVNKNIYLVGVDALAEALTAISENKMTGTVFNDHFSQSHKAAKVGAEFLAGGKVANVNMVDYQKVTHSNAAEILARLG